VTKKVGARRAVPFCGDGLLSNRESECLKHLSRGGTVKCIAEELNLSPRTVEYYLSGAKRKLKHHSKEQLIRFYWDHYEGMTKNRKGGFQTRPYKRKEQNRKNELSMSIELKDSGAI
jgi:DNA-binding CsgD family transcriptional regulator